MINLPFPSVELVHRDDTDSDSVEKEVVIETGRLRLRGAREFDVDGLHECFRDSLVMRYWSSLPHTNLEATSKWVKTMMNSKRNGVTDFVIELRSAESAETKPGPDSRRGSCIGKVGVWEGNEIGFIIAQRYWKRGLATEAVTAVLDYIFELGITVDLSAESADILTLANTVCREGQGDASSPRWPPEAIVADVDPRNDLSLNALRKLGFEVYATKEKTLQVGDEWVDSVYLSLTGKDWLERRRIEQS